MRIWNSEFKCSYLKNEKLSLHFLFHFWILHQILNTLTQKIIVIANVFPKLLTVKCFLENSLKSTFSEQALAVNMWKHRKCLLNVHVSAFIMFFNHSQWSWLRKCLPQSHVKFKGCLLTHWHPMASILLKVVRICNS